MSTLSGISGKERFNCIFCASFIHDRAHVDGIKADYEKALAAIGAVCCTTNEDKMPACIAQEDALLFFVLTGGVENQILDLWKKREQFVPGRPVFLVSHPLHNSLPAALETLARFRQDKVKGEIMYLDGPDDHAGLAHLKASAHALNVRNLLAKDRIGLVGDPSSWLIASSPAPETVREAFGPEVVQIPISELDPYIAAAAGAETVAAKFKEIFPEISGPTDSDLLASARIYLGLKAMIKKYELNALTVRCFDLVVKNKASGCLALSLLNDEGIIAGCEADLVSLMGMLWAWRLTGCLPWMANPSHIIPERNILWLAHCTVPSKLVHNHVLKSHFESGLGIGVQGTFDTGPVTLLRLGGKDLKEIWLAHGTLFESGDSPNLCRTQIHVRLEHARVTDLLKNPLGNHIVMIRGHQKNLLQDAWQQMTPS
ncbi:MAG: hypothetical protein AB7T27_07595 [Kiritimatiellia bacterium]